MSVRVMSLIWEIKELSPIEKLALLALADWADDDGLAWPSIRQLAEKTGCSERTVQRAFRTAEKMGLLTSVVVPGKGCKWSINPRHSVTPVTVSPPSQCHPTPVTVTPNTPIHTNTNSNELVDKPRERKADPFPMIEGCDPEHWQDFLQNRKRKRKPNTATAHKRLCDDIKRWTDAEWPPGRLIEHAAAEGWAGIYNPRDKIKFQGNRHEQPKNGLGKTGSAASALRERLAMAAAPARYG